MSRSSQGKPLKGHNTISQRGGLVDIDQISANGVFIDNTNLADLLTGDFAFDPVDIDSGTIDGVVIGNDEPGPATFTNLTTGDVSGTGFDVLMYATTFGDFVRWDSNNSKFIINGSLLVRDASQSSGNILIDGNTISSTNVNGDIVLDPNGTGCLVIESCIVQNSTTGDVSFNVENGVFTALSTGNITLESGDNNILMESQLDTQMTTINGDINLSTEHGSRLCISSISAGSGSVSVSTVSDHGLSPGDLIEFQDTNSTPDINGSATVFSVTNDKTFTISDTVSLSGNSGRILLFPKISGIAIGNPTVITTVNKHNLKTGDTITISGSNSFPSIDGTRTVLSVASTNVFSISGTIISTGSSGSLKKTLDNKISIESTLIKIDGDIEINSGGCSGSSEKIINFRNSALFFDELIPTFGGVNDLTSNDNKDRGFSYKWHDGISPQVGFFGFDNGTECLTYIPKATIINDIVSGTAGCFNIGDITATQIDLQGGDILNSGTITASILQGDPDITLNAVDIYLTASGDVIMPADTNIEFGSPSNFIQYSTTEGFCINSSTDIKLTPGAGYDVIIPRDIGIVFDGTHKIESNGTDLTLTTPGDLDLNASTAINVPTGVPLTFGGDTNNLVYDGTNFNANIDGDINLVPTTGNDVTIPCDIGLLFTGSVAGIDHRIESDCSDLNIYSTKTIGDSDINLLAKSSINVPVNVPVAYGSDSHTILGNGADLNINSSTDINLNGTNDVNIPLNVGLTFGTDTSKIENNGTNLTIDTENNLVQNATGNIINTSSTGDVSLISTIGDVYLTPTDSSKSVKIPQLVDLEFGSIANITTDVSNNLLISTSSDTTISSNDINLTATTKVLLPVSIPIEFGNSSENVIADGTNLDINSGNNININAILTKISGNLQVDGTTTTVNSTTVTVDDPIITLGGDVPPVTDDNKDRGIEFRYHDGVSDKLGFFGMDDSTGCFTFIPDATNINEVFSGTPGCINVGDVTATQLDLQNGDIVNANIINLNALHGNPDLTLTATNDINLTATNDINIPNNVGLTFGDDSNVIEYTPGILDQLTITTDGTLVTNSESTVINSDTSIDLNATTDVTIPQDTELLFGDINNYIVSDGTDLCFVSTGDIKLDSVNIKLSASSSIDIPSAIPINLNNSESVYIVSTGDQLSLVSGLDVLINPGAGFDTRIPVNTGLIFESSGTGNKIEYNGTDLCIDSTGDIKLTPAGGDTVITGNITTATWLGNTVGVTYGGTGKSSWTEGSVVFAGTGGTSLAEDNLNLFWTNSTNRLSIGSNSGIDHALTLANSGKLSFRNSFDTDEPGIVFQNANRSYTWNVYRSAGSGSNSDFHIAGGINQTTIGALADRLIIKENGTVGINFPDNTVAISSNSVALETIISTSTDHDLDTGNVVTISGSNSIPSINGSYTITKLSNNTFSIPVNVSVAGTTGSIFIKDTNRVDTSGKIKLHVNGCIKSECLLLGENEITFNDSGDLVFNTDTDIDFNVTSPNTINIPSNVHMTFGDTSTFIAFDGTDLCLESSGDIKVTPAGADFIINGNLFVTGSSNIGGGGGGGGFGEVDEYILCLGKGQDLFVSSIVDSGSGNVDVTTATHNLVTGDTVTFTNTDSDPVIDGTYTATVISTTVVRVAAGPLTTSGTTGNMRTSHVIDQGKDIGICFKWHDGLVTGTANQNEGFFGFDRSTERFKFVPDSSVTASVVSGTLGDIEAKDSFFENVTASTLTDTEVVFASTGGLLVSDSDMTYNSTTNTLTVPNVNADNLVEKADFDANTILKADVDDTPIALTVPEDTIVGRIAGGQITALTPAEVSNLLNLSGNFERINVPVASTVSSIGLGDPSSIVTVDSHGLITGDTITISGSDSVPSLDGVHTVTVTGVNSFTVSGTTVTTVGSIGSIAPSVADPDPSINVTFVTVLGTGVASGNLAVTTDGRFKHILLSARPTGSSYELTLTLLDPGSTIISSKKLVFTCPGQSSYLIYDAVLGTWMIVNSGAFVD